MKPATRVTGEIKWVGPKLDELPPDQRAFVIDKLARILADVLVAEFRRNPPQPAGNSETERPTSGSHPDNRSSESPWLTARQAAAHAQVGLKVIYRAVSAGQLRAIRVGGRRTLRFRVEYIDRWLEGLSTISPGSSQAPQ